MQSLKMIQCFCMLAAQMKHPLMLLQQVSRYLSLTYGHNVCFVNFNSSDMLKIHNSESKKAIILTNRLRLYICLLLAVNLHFSITRETISAGAPGAAQNI